MSFIVVIIALALIFDYINGFHDAANSIATIVSTKVLTPFQAVIWAALFNFAAFFIFKDHGVANTISNTVKSEFITLHVVLAGLIAAITWNLITWWFGIPSSSSHTLIGGFAGAGIANGGWHAVNADPILKTASFIIAAPFVGMVIAFIISLWFMYSFRKDIMPRIISVLVIVLVGFFMYNMLIFDRAILAKGTHFKSYALQVIFYTKNFKWVLLGLVTHFFHFHILVEYIKCTSFQYLVQATSINIFCRIQYWSWG